MSSVTSTPLGFSDRVVSCWPENAAVQHLKRAAPFLCCVWQWRRLQLCESSYSVHLAHFSTQHNEPKYSPTNRNHLQNGTKTVWVSQSLCEWGEKKKRQSHELDRRNGVNWVPGSRKRRFKINHVWWTMHVSIISLHFIILCKSPQDPFISLPCIFRVFLSSVQLSSPSSVSASDSVSSMLWLHAVLFAWITHLCTDANTHCVEALEKQTLWFANVMVEKIIIMQSLLMPVFMMSKKGKRWKVCVSMCEQGMSNHISSSVWFMVNPHSFSTQHCVPPYVWWW